ncbi:hypothetical protein, partial [Acinetobacter baumannii]|uniref:hypothetical protein n=1 Tax=Acinetobacter baumannii TaxID=470 RepID=UPI001BB46411
EASPAFLNKEAVVFLLPCGFHVLDKLHQSQAMRNPLSKLVVMTVPAAFPGCTAATLLEVLQTVESSSPCGSL